MKNKRPIQQGLHFVAVIYFLLIISPLMGSMPLDQWTYIEVDNARTRARDLNQPGFMRSFGLDAGDLNGDGNLEIVAGRYIYLNPRGAMTDAWKRVELGLNVDLMLVMDVDGDAYGDIIGTALPNVYWVEAKDAGGQEWMATQVGSIPPTGHANGQGYALAQIIPGGKPEIILTGGDGVYMLTVPEDVRGKQWPVLKIANGTMEEGFALADFDHDGDLDLVAGVEEGKAFSVVCFFNPGDGSGDWPGVVATTKVDVPDRIVAADLNGDGWTDIAVSEERYPGLEPDANLNWFDGANPTESEWPQHHLIETWSLNNLDAGDIDLDGDMDLVTCEHKGPKEKLMIFENDGNGGFTCRVIDEGKESHLGSRLFDLDNDGDLDIVSVPWDDFRFLHVWRNDGVVK